LEKKATSAILVTLILFTGLIGVISVPVVTEVIPTTEVFYGDGRQVFEQGLYVIATETNPVEMYSNYTNKKAYYDMLRDHVTTAANTEQFISILISRGVCASSGYSVGIESIEKIDNDFVLGANFTQKGWDEYICSAHMYDYLGTGTWTESFNVLLPAPDLSIEGIVLPYWGPVLYINPAPSPEFFYMINATVTNLGTTDAGSFNVSFSVLLNEIEVPEYDRKKTISGLAQGASETVWFEFGPENYGNYTLFMEADCDNDVLEADETNNVKPTWVIGTIAGDLCGDSSGSPPDGDVDWFDFGEFVGIYGMSFEQPPYDPRDFNYDGAVDWFDFGIFAQNFGRKV